MSSELERLLREAGRRLPEPGAEVTRRARESARGALRRRRFRRPAMAVLAAALVASGVGIGALVAPSGSAAPAVVGLGFLPAQGWSVLQSGGDGTAVRPMVAFAANVPISPDDDPDGLPLSTLLTLPPEGVVVIATFTNRGDQPWHDQYYPPRELPLRARDASTPFGVQIRPERPLGQYELKAGAEGHNVDLNIYFGTTRPTAAHFAAAQRQLDRLVVPPALGERKRGTAQVAAPKVVDRTFVCRGEPGASWSIWAGSHWVTNDPDLFEGYLALTSGNHPTKPLVYVRARSYAAGAYPGVSGVYAKTKVPGCFGSKKSVPLRPAGLPGPPVLWEKIVECETRGRVIVRVRATIESAGLWRRVNPEYLGARGNVTQATLAVRSEATGRLLALIEMDRASNTKLWYAGSCG